MVSRRGTIRKFGKGRSGQHQADGAAFHFRAFDPRPGNNRRFLQVLVLSLLSRAREGVARTGYEKRTHHQSMVDLLTSLDAELREGGIPSELTAPEKNPVTAGSEARDFLGKAETEITIVDSVYRR